MATVPEQLHESMLGTVSEKWIPLLDRLERGPRWLVVAASLLAFGLLYAVLLVGAAFAAMYIGVLVPGSAGSVAFFTIGLALVAVAPTVARRLFIRVHEPLETGQETEASGK